MPGSEFVISRIALRSNKSDYFINDRRSNFKEVTDLLRGKGIDLDNNRFLILQVGTGSQRGDGACNCKLPAQALLHLLLTLPSQALPQRFNAGRGGADQHDEAQGSDRA